MKSTAKKLLSIVLTATMIFGTLAFGLSDVDWSDFAVKVKAEDLTEFTEGYYAYTVDEKGNATITDVDEEISGNVIIPSTLDGYTVTSIGESAFSWCGSLTSVTIPDSVTSIGKDAFAYCGSLTSIIIPDSVTSIGDRAFYWCDSLANVTIPDSVTSISDWAFSNCYSLTSVTIPDSITSIGKSAFYDCDNLTNITIPDSVTSIGDWAFYSCDSFTSVTIPESVTSIGESAFYDCTGLTSIKVDEPNEHYSNDEYGVLFNKNKTELIQYPIGNTRMNYVIPDSVTSIGDGAFYNCNSLTDVYYNGTEEQWNEISIGDYNEPLTNATIHFNYVPEDEPATEPTTQPEETTAIPETTAPIETEPSTTKPIETPTTKPTEPPTTKPVEAPTTTQPIATEPSTTKPVEVPSTTKPTDEPTTEPVATVPSTTEPTTEPAKPEEEIVKKPSTSIIKYGDSIILHANIENLPEGAKIVWTADNDNFTYTASADGATCTVSPSTSGDTVFTATVYDADGNEICSDTQTMTSKAGFFQKIIAFFKKLFGLTKVIPEMFKK